MRQRLVSAWSSWSYRRRLVTITALGVLWRLVYVPFERPLRIWSDEHWYMTQAHRLVEGHPWSSIFNTDIPSASHGPLVSVAIAPFAWLFPTAMTGLRFLIPLVGAVSIVGLATFVRRVSASDRAALIAAVLAAVYPGLWVRDGLVVSEQFAIAAFVWLLALQPGWGSDRRWRHTVLIGVLVAVIALARAELLVLAVLVVAVSWWWHRATVSKVRGLTVVLIAAVLCSPWVIYNQGRFAKPVYLSTNLGITLAGANCHLAYYDGRFIGYDDMGCWSAAAKAHPSLDESVRSSGMTRDAWAYATAHAHRWPIVVAAREAWFFGLYRPNWVVYMSKGAGQRVWASWAQAVGGYILFPTFLWALWERRKKASSRERLARRLIILTALFSVALAGAFVGHWRYRLGLDVVALVAVALWLDGRRVEAAHPTA